MPIKRYFRRLRRDRSTLSSDATISDKAAAITTEESEQSLENSEQRFGRLEVICGWIVLVGVVFEYGPKFIVFIQSVTFAHFRDLGGGLLITLGIAGEIIFSSLAARKRDKLRKRHVSRIASLNLQAEQERHARVRIEETLRAAEERIAVLDKEAAEARLETAKAQLELQKRIEYIRKQTGPRMLSPRFTEALKDRPKGTADILYAPEDTEAYTFAIQICNAVKSAGWGSQRPKPIPSEGGIPGFSPDVPAQIRHGTSGPIALISKSSPPEHQEKTAPGAIWEAVTSALDVNFGFTSISDPTLPDNHFVIVIGQKQ